MDRMLKVCSQCQHEHYFEDFCPGNCDNCNSPLVGNAYPVKLLDQVTQAIDIISNRLDYNFDEALNYLFKVLAAPQVSENLLNDPSIWKILQPPK
ncbi:hypothetical protein BMF77_pa00025 (plasmid) [Dolichospermum sp. UHCC 0315A]|jgi:hypothetical protein|uniref:hypothetical protein n=1 Tax=Nostocales TaxID=1161 RepID=UPI0007FEFB81|nr:MULTISPECIES: hypothetical protein [Nostocales]OBQ13706.1 MAG: hypothetical protein AN490_02220 [Anabaena sp. AL09]QEI44310.1 hypothetical protein BMF77_04942 [Dolichospermum sp. UHCC 0315A]QEI44367.1 hypothetical protein BMF77_pa00025 [Dolichospermum sp. UHCC 0315A]QSV65145.1 MAG: hypothetical protein HEQ26_22770 [Dolichospermum sp. DL01]